VFAVGNNGQLYVSWVIGAGNWNGSIGLPFPPVITLATFQPQDGWFVSVAGEHFTEGGGVSLAYDIEAGGAPTTHEKGQTSAQADASGSFSARINVNLTDVSAAYVEATDLASGRTADSPSPSPEGPRTWRGRRIQRRRRPRSAAAGAAWRPIPPRAPRACSGVYPLTAPANGVDHETFLCTVRGSPSVGSAV
jgi:hypothetical protein